MSGENGQGPGDSELTRTTQDSPDAPGAPRCIGPYRLLQRIGEGGMGEVYEAEQERPVRRRVALKLIKRGMDTKEVIARFESERQALALMDHPNIARVFDAGSTEEGLPYFVMELVHGVPITEHCDRQRLPTRERLELFLRVCDAVQHAHQKAVIHRDIKPSNILISFQDEQAVPKIIDFGVAKAIAQPLCQRTLFTEMGQLIGTPGYMSPEQAEMSGQGIDTRTDVYSLGAVLYELLVGAQPFDPETLRGVGFDAMRRMIREVEPPRPSTRVEALGKAAAATATNRQTTARLLMGELRGDLDWIAMKALEKDRGRRYGSPSDLAADIRHHLKDEPVVARPPSTAYRMERFIRRHRVAVASLAGIFLVLILFAVTTAIQAGRIARERDRAVEAEASAQAINDFLVKDMLGMASPERALGRQVTVQEVLGQADQRVGGAFPNQPGLEVPVRLTIGGIHMSLGKLDEGEQQIEAALQLARDRFGEDDPRTLRALRARAKVLSQRGLFAEAEPILRDVLQKQRRLLGDRAPHTLQTLEDLGFVLAQREASTEQRAEAGRLKLEVLEARRAIHGIDHEESIRALANYANYLLASDSPDAARYVEEAAERSQRVLGDNNTLTVFALTLLAQVYGMSGKATAAEAATRRTLEATRAVYGENHPRTIYQMAALADWLAELERPAEAEEMLRQAVEAWKTLPIQSSRFFYSFSLVERLYGNGKLREAEAVARSELAIPDSAIGRDDPQRLLLTVSLGVVLRGQGRLQEAEACYRRVLEGRERSLGRDHMYTVRVLAQLADLLSREGRHAEGEAMARDALARGLATFPAGWDADGQRATVHECLGRVLLRTDRAAEAEGHFREAIEFYSKYPVERPVIAELQTWLAEALIRQGRPADGLALLQSAWPVLFRNRGAGNPMREQARGLLEDLAVAEETRAAARALLADARP
ncbi:MAG: serine/threonine-protein kinase [Candidatus Eisenbacteria bacterium]